MKNLHLKTNLQTRNKLRRDLIKRVEYIEDLNTEYFRYLDLRRVPTSNDIWIRQFVHYSGSRLDPLGGNTTFKDLKTAHYLDIQT